MLLFSGKPSQADNAPHLEHGPSFKKRLGWWIRSGKAATITLDVTPQMAEEMLAYNDRNRPLSSGQIKKYLADMKDGRWHYTRVPVIFSNERLIDGQHRCDLTKEERDRQIRRYAELLEAREVDVVSRQDDAKLSVRGRAEGRPQGTASKIAEETGLSVRTVQRVLAEPKPPKPVPPAREPHNDFEVVQKQVDSLMRAWNAAGPEARQQFLDSIDKPVFDQTGAA